MNLLDRYLTRTDFSSYEEFVSQFGLKPLEHFNFAIDVVDVYAREVPEKRALVWCDDAGHSRSFTFAELKAISDRTANYFRTLGIGKGDPVMLVMKGRYEFWFCMLALHKLGAVAIPATHMMKVHDITYRIQQADIVMAVCVADNDLLGYVDEAQAATGDILRHKVIINGRRAGWDSFEDGLDAAPETFQAPTGAAAPCLYDMMLLYFTSGTTGMPKMVGHNFTYPLAHILTAKYWQCVEDDGLHYTLADTGWAKAVWGKIYGQWLAGTAVFVYDYERFSAAGVLDMATRHGVTTFCAPPTVYRFLIKEDLSKYDLRNLHYCVTAGEPLNPEVYERFLEQTGIRLMEGYGQTELVVSAATWPWMTPKPGSMGRPSPTYDIVLVGPEGVPVERGEEGEIAIRTTPGRPLGIFGGYLRDEALTTGVWHDGLYHTGDMAWEDEDGYLWFIGRADDVIKSSGYRIGPFEVESALIQHPAVVECAVTGVPDEDRGQVVKATVVLAKGYSPSPELVTELQQHVKNVTAPYKYPRVIEFAAQLPKTISGKIRRTEIRARDRTAPADADAAD
jgi:acetyl-CoA synthetase